MKFKSILAFIVALLPWWLFLYAVYTLVTLPLLPDLPPGMQNQTSFKGYRLEANSPDVTGVFTERYWSWMMIATILPGLIFLMSDRLSTLIWYLISKRI